MQSEQTVSLFSVQEELLLCTINYCCSALCRHILRLTCRRFRRMVDFYGLVRESGFGPSRLVQDAVNDSPDAQTFWRMVQWLDANGAIPYLQVGGLVKAVKKFGTTLNPYLAEITDRFRDRIIEECKCKSYDYPPYRGDKPLFPGLKVAMVRAGYRFDRIVAVHTRINTRSTIATSELVDLFVECAPTQEAIDDAISSYELSGGVRYLPDGILYTLSPRYFENLVVRRGYPLMKPLCALMFVPPTDERTFRSLVTLATQQEGANWHNNNMFFDPHQVDHGVDVICLIDHLVSMEHVVGLQIIREIEPKWLEPRWGGDNRSNRLWECIIRNRPKVLEFVLSSEIIKPTPSEIWEGMCTAAEGGFLEVADILMLKCGHLFENKLPIPVTPLHPSSLDCVEKRPTWYRAVDDFSEYEPLYLHRHLNSGLSRRVEGVGSLERCRAECENVTWLLQRYATSITARQLAVICKFLAARLGIYPNNGVVLSTLERVASTLEQKDASPPIWMLEKCELSVPLLQFLERRMPGGRFERTHLYQLTLRGWNGLNCLRWLWFNGYAPELVSSVMSVDDTVTMDEDMEFVEYADNYEGMAVVPSELRAAYYKIVWDAKVGRLLAETDPSTGGPVTVYSETFPEIEDEPPWFSGVSMTKCNRSMFYRTVRCWFESKLQGDTQGCEERFVSALIDVP